MKLRIIPWIPLFFIMAAIAPAQAGYISRVTVDPEGADPARGQTAAISWETGAKGLVDLYICDMDGVVVRRLMDRTRCGAGSHTAQWDGTDDGGGLLPNGAYFPFIRIITHRGSFDAYEPVQGRWGGRLPVKDLAYDPDLKEITYTLEKPAICLVRIGEKQGGPSYGTLLHWVARPAGDHREPWNGMDLQNLFEVHSRKNFNIIFDTLALPANAILLRGSTASHTRPDPAAERLSLHPPTGRDIYIHSLHPRYLCRDPELKVTVLEGLETAAGTLPGTRGPVMRFEVTAVDPDQAQNMAFEGCEVYIFVDGVFQQEIKTRTLPAAISLSAAGISPGRHILTFNLRSIEDHVGSFSMQIAKGGGL